MNADKRRPGLLHRWVLTIALALMLAISQQGALVHEISHFQDYNGSSSTGSASQPDDDDDDGDGGDVGGKAAPGHFCAKCVAFSALASSLVALIYQPPLLANSFEPVVYSSTSHYSLTFLSYAARAPPVFS